MIVKFIQYWNILSGCQGDFDRFITHDYIPQINQTGLLRIVGSWRVVSGEGPNFILEGAAQSLRLLNEMLRGNDFEKLDHLLRFLITGYKSKILISTGDLTALIPSPANCRFNHHFEVEAERSDDYRVFFRAVQIPTLQRLGIETIGSWYVGVGPGPNTVVEGSSPAVTDILRAIDSPAYKEMSDRLQTMASAFGSRILAPSGHLD
jgi:hypothetical protein